MGGCAPRLLGCVVCRGEEGLEHRTEASMWVDCERDEDHVFLVEFANDGVAMDERGGCGGGLVDASEFGSFMSLKVVVCIGSDGF